MKELQKLNKRYTEIGEDEWELKQEKLDIEKQIKELEPELGPLQQIVKAINSLEDTIKDSMEKYNKSY